MQCGSGHVRNIHFPFDTDNDTSIAVASEMVEELDLTDQDVSTIAEMIDAEIRSCIPEWAPKDYDDDQEDNNEASPSASADSTSDSPQKDSPSASPLTIKSSTSPALLALERLPSGRKYWCDSPKGCFSTLRPQNLSEDNTQSGPTSNVNHDSSNNASIEKTEGDDDIKDDDNTEENEYDDDDDVKDDDNTEQKDYEDDDEDVKDDNNIKEKEDENEEIKVETIVEKLENLLLDQQKEMEELKRKHGLVVSDILNKLRPKTRQEVADICKVDISDPEK